MEKITNATDTTTAAAVVVAKRKGGIKGIPHVTKAVLAMTVEDRQAWLVKAGAKLTAEHLAILTENLAKAVANPPKAGNGAGRKIDIDKMIEKMDFETLSELIAKAEAALSTKATAEEAEAQKVLDDQARICAKAQAVIDQIKAQKLAKGFGCNNPKLTPTAVVAKPTNKKGVAVTA